MRILLTAAALMLAAPVAMPAFAQSATQDAQTGPQNKAVKGMHENNSAMPVKGANSFTRMEAQKQIEAKGYTHVAGLTKDKEGIWRGTADKDGASGPVSVDYQGNVN
jgi:hypothetical protein